MQKDLEKKVKEEKEILKETKNVPEAELKKNLSPTWAQECIEDIDDWIESQGIYLRQ